MINLYKSTETDFSHNGVAALDNGIYDAVVKESINGSFTFEFKYPIFVPGGNLIKGQTIVKASTPTGYQLFRLVKPEKELGILSVLANHISYDIADNFIEDTNIVDKDGDAAIKQICSKLQFDHKFNFSSNITKVASARMVRLNGTEAILDDNKSNSFISRWGGEVKRDNFDFKMLQRRGEDRGYRVTHGTNLQSFQGTIDYSDLTTRILPIGYDGLMLPEKYVDSDKLEDYPHPHIQMIKYNDIRAISDSDTEISSEGVQLEEAYQLLRDAAKTEYEINHLDEPASNWKVDVINLVDTEEYKDYADVLKLLPWDDVTVDDEVDDVLIHARMISYEWDPTFGGTEELPGSYTNIEIGNYMPNTADVISEMDKVQQGNDEKNDELQDTIDEESQKQQDALDEAIKEESDKQDEAIKDAVTESNKYALEAANGRNKNYYGDEEPTGDIQEGDQWFKGALSNGEAEILIYHNGKWIAKFPAGIDQSIRDDFKNASDLMDKQIGEAGFDNIGALASATSDNKQQVSSIKLSVNGLQTSVTNLDAKTKTQITQLSNAVDIVASDITNLDNTVSARITTAVNNGIASIRLQVGTGGLSIVSNAGKSPDITISGSTLRITADTYIESGSIKNAAIANLDAGKIVTGSLSGINITGRAMINLAPAGGGVNTVISADNGVSTGGGLEVYGNAAMHKGLNVDSSGFFGAGIQLGSNGTTHIVVPGRGGSLTYASDNQWHVHDGAHGDFVLKP